MKTRYFLLYLLCALLPASFSGCGSNSDNNKSVSALAASKACIDCHIANSKSISTVTGERITDTWKLSAHNTANGAGCRDCHSSPHYHNIISENCRGCHVTLSSSHKTGNSCSQCHGASSTAQSDCRTCHKIPHLEPIGDPNIKPECIKCHKSSTPVDVALKNPDAAGKCFSCHKSKLNSAHFRNMTAGVNAVSSAMYVTRNFEKGCTACHEPHNPLKGIGAAERKAWSKSGHGNVNAPAFEDEDFKTNKSCIRCHTSTGYSNFLANNWTTPFPAATWGVAGDKGREVLTCRTCHIDYSFKVKPAPAFVAPYNSSKSPRVFPDVGESNLCLACHSGRESEDSIAAFKNFSNASFKNSHYKAGAALMYMAAGFRNFTSLDTVINSSTPTTYRKTLYPDNTTVPTYGITGGVSSTHRKLGTRLINGDSHNAAFFVYGTADANGPCVTCHLNVNGKTRRVGTGHTWSIDANAFDQLCVKCHNEEGGIPLTGANFQTIFLEEQAVGFVDALGLIAYLLETNYKIKYNPGAHPYFYDLQKDPTGKTAVKDWTRSKMFGGNFDQVLGKRLMGAAFNLNLLKKDAAAYVHGRTFARRLIFDTIDYLDDRTLNFSPATAAIAYDPVKYGKNATNAYTDGTLSAFASGTTIDMVYLLGWSRSTGKWNSPVRP